MVDETTPFLTVPEVARLIGRSPERTYALIATGIVPGVKIGGQVRIPRRAFEQWLDQLTERALAGVNGAERPTPAA